MICFIKKILTSLLNPKEKKWSLIFPILFLSIFIVLTTEVYEAQSGQEELIGSIDQFTTDFLINHRSSLLNGYAIDLTALGSGLTLTLLSIIMVLFFYGTNQYKEALQMVMTILGSSLITIIFKLLFARTRPPLPLHLIEVDGFSYPSGHSLISAAVYSSIAFCYYKFLKKAHTQFLFLGFFFSLILLIGISRIYLGIHYFSDVLAGILVGLTWTMVVKIGIEHHISEKK